MDILLKVLNSVNQTEAINYMLTICCMVVGFILVIETMDTWELIKKLLKNRFKSRKSNNLNGAE